MSENGETQVNAGRSDWYGSNASSVSSSTQVTLMERALSKADLEEQLNDFKKFAFGLSMIQTCIAFALGAAFGKIINATVNNLIMPVVNYGINATGTDWRTLIWVPVKGMKIEIGAFIGASIDFVLISLVLYAVWKFAQKYAAPPDIKP